MLRLYPRNYTVIGRIKFPRFLDDGTTLSATLEDTKTWTCEAASVARFLNLKAPTADLPTTTQLHTRLEILPQGANIAAQRKRNLYRRSRLLTPHAVLRPPMRLIAERGGTAWGVNGCPYGDQGSHSGDYR